MSEGSCPATSRWRTRPRGPLSFGTRPHRKHLRHAAFLGMHDSVQGSSANVLTGGSVTFGTSGFSVFLDAEVLSQLATV